MKAYFYTTYVKQARIKLNWFELFINCHCHDIACRLQLHSAPFIRYSDLISGNEFIFKA